MRCMVGVCQRLRWRRHLQSHGIGPAPYPQGVGFPQPSGPPGLTTVMGIHFPNVLFFPLRGDEHSVDRISGFQYIVLHYTSTWLPLTLRGASRHADTLASPVDLWVVMGKP